jgi:lactate dehydrogenase-like 2-hydroxyacid dehydrogenase
VIASGQRHRIAYTARLPEPIERSLHELYDATRIEHLDLSRLDAGIEALVVTPSTSLPAPAIEALPASIGLIASYSVGTDHIDLAAAAARALPVTNTPDVLTDATADIAMLLILSACRQASIAERELRAGRWRGLSMADVPGIDLAGRSLGIFGFGRIGQATARRARVFGMQIVYHGPQRKPAAERELEARFEPDREAFLRTIDVLSLHAPATAATRHFVDREALALLRKGSVVVNTARGPLVDDAALIEALRERHLHGAGLDVYDGEPAVNAGYLELDNVTLLPHIGSATIETRVAMGRRVLANLEAHFAGRPLPNQVGTSRTAA